MTKRKRFILNGILLSSVGLAVRAVSMAFNSYITKTVGAEGIGLFSLIMTVYSFAITFATSGISLTVTRLVAEAIGDSDDGRIRSIMRHAVLYALIFSIFSAMVLFFFSEYFANAVLGDERAMIPLRILAFSLVPIALLSVFSGYFIGVRRVAKNALVQVLGQSFKIGITVFFVLKFFGKGVRYATIALCLSTTVTEILTFAVSFLQYIFDKKSKTTPKKSARFYDVAQVALPLALSAYIRSALLTLEHILIPKRLRDGGAERAASIASYGILHGMALPLLVFPMSPLSSFSGLLVPEFAESMAEKNTERMYRMASEAISTTLVYSIAASVFLYIFSEELGFVFYNSYEAGRFIALMAPVVPIMYLDHVTDSMLKGLGEQVYSMWINISDSLLSVILVWCLVPVMGISGYAVVIVVMEAYNFIFSMLRLRKKIKFKVKPVASILLPFVCAILSARICHECFIMGGRGASGLWLFLKIVFATSLFIAVYIPIKRVSIPTFTLKISKTRN